MTGLYNAIYANYVLPAKQVAKAVLYPLEEMVARAFVPQLVPVFAYQPQPHHALPHIPLFAAMSGSAGGYNYSYIRSNDLLVQEIQSPDNNIRHRAALAALIWYVEVPRDRDKIDAGMIDVALGMYHHNRSSVAGFVKGGKAYELLMEAHVAIEGNGTREELPAKKKKPVREDEFPF